MQTIISILFFFFNDTATTEIYTTRHTLSLHDALPISRRRPRTAWRRTRTSTRTAPRSEEHTSELQSRLVISYAVFCLKKKKKYQYQTSLEFFSSKIYKSMITKKT